MTSAVHSLLAYSSDGRVMAIAQEREILVYSGTDESPLWRCACDADIVAVGAGPEFVFALDHNGQINRWNATTGESRQTVNTNSPALGMAVAANGDSAVIASACISIIRNMSVIQTLELKSITAVAWSADGSLLACAEADGRLSVYPRADQHGALSTKALARTFLNDRIVSLISHNDGSWIAASGNAVWQVDPQRTYSNALMGNTPQPTQLVAISPDGRLLAFTMGDQEIIALHLNPGAMAGVVNYQERSITGLAFGPDSRLAIGLDTGDGNIIDLSQPPGRIFRTDPHPGRPLNRWSLNVSVLPRSQKSIEPAGVSSDSQSVAIPSWAGPVIGPVIGLLIGLKVSREVNPDAATATMIGGALVGLVGGVIMWFIDHSKQK